MSNPTQHQVGGDHYTKLAIQPVEYIHANGIGFCEGSVIKYVTRWCDKGGIDDLRKAKHFLELLIELESPAPVMDAAAYASNAWEEGERRMDNIARSHGDGEHYALNCGGASFESRQGLTQ